uniref:Prolyl 4-hydroxylase alpha subunit domain-containing protein n=1 Tax=Attheya septentrionalis TaxID=420275 RepID=A0A7S2UAX1_9STRA|mmetsp:Transcript_17823/g.32263  ORF Transcript_17823/g.32263 Transcript_17823/m.32263 type:complete len:325 (+) Transcript_17823:138-1112(+)
MVFGTRRSMARRRSKRNREAAADGAIAGAAGQTEPPSSRDDGKGPVWMRLLLKLGTYGMAYFMFQQFNKFKKEGALDHRTIWAGPGRQPVVVIDDFLQEETAIRWRDVLLYEFQREVKGDGDSSSVSKSLQKWELDPSHPFSLEMWKHFSSDKVTNRVPDLLLGSDSQKKDSTEVPLRLLELAVRRNHAGGITYASETSVDSKIEDGAFVIVSFLSATQNEDSEWKEEFGGLLQLSCPDEEADVTTSSSPSWCENLLPKFNTAVIFPTTSSTGSKTPNHQITKVESEFAMGTSRFEIIAQFAAADRNGHDDKKATAPSDTNSEL